MKLKYGYDMRIILPSIFAVACVRFRTECVDGRMAATWLLDNLLNQCEYICSRDVAQAGHNFNEP